MNRTNSLTTSDKLVLTTLEILIDNQEQEPIKRSHIANIAGVSLKTVTTSLKRLRARGIISTERPNPGTHYTYTIYKDKAPQFDENSLLALLRS